MINLLHRLAALSSYIPLQEIEARKAQAILSRDHASSSMLNLGIFEEQLQRTILVSSRGKIKRLTLQKRQPLRRRRVLESILLPPQEQSITWTGRLQK